MPGDNIRMKAQLIHPIAMEEGLRFAIREGGHTVGAGVVRRSSNKIFRKRKKNSLLTGWSFFVIFYNSRFCAGYNTKMSADTSSGRNMFKPFRSCVSLRLPEGFSCAAHKSKEVNRRQKKKKGREKQKREKRGKREEKARKDKKTEKEERKKRRERSRKQRIKNLQ